MERLCPRPPLTFFAFSTLPHTADTRCASKKVSRAPFSQHHPCHRGHSHGHSPHRKRSKNQNTTSQSWRWKRTRNSSRQTRRRWSRLHTGSVSRPYFQPMMTYPRSFGKHLPTRRLRRSTRAITPARYPLPQTPVLLRWVTRCLACLRRNMYMRVTLIYPLACLRPQSARTSVRGRVKQLQRRLVLLPYYVGPERCAFTRFSMLTSNAHRACV